MEGVTSSPTSYHSSERDRDAQISVGSNSSSSGHAGVIGSKPGTPGPATPSSPWSQVSARRPVGSAIGSERIASGAASPSVNTSIASGGDWFPPLMGKIGQGNTGEKSYPGLDRRVLGGAQDPGVDMHSSINQSQSGVPSRSASTTGLSTIGSERRQASEVRSSRPPSPTTSASAHQSPRDTMSSSGFYPQPPSAISIAPPPSDTPTAAQQQQSTGTSNNNNISSSSSELESAFDAMLRGSHAFQDLINRVGSMEAQVQHLLAQSGGNHSNGHFDITPTRSPSVAPSSNYLTAQTGGSSRPPSLLIPNHTASPSIVSTALHSPALSQPAGTEPSTPSYGNLPNSANTSAERDVIRQLSAQLSALGSNVAQLMAQQPPQTPGGGNVPGPVTPNSAGGWGGYEQHHPAAHVHGPQHPHGRPNLSNLRASSYDVPRGAVLPRGSAAAAAAYGEEREARKRSHLTLQAPIPMGMGSRRHSADVVENMHNVAEGMPGPGGPGLGNQSLLGKWEALGVSGELLRAIIKYGIGPPSKIQMKAIPCVLNTQDIVAQASSIQERIQCYVIPALQHVYTALSQASMSNMSDSMELPPQPPKGVLALILTATIDQAGQAHRMCLGLGQSLGISSSLVVGQGDVSSELATLSANPPHILVGTPQKLLDILSIRSIPTDKLSLLVIDEMDQLIARNLSDYVNNLAKLLPPPISGGTSSRDRSPGSGASNGFKPFENGGSARSQERQTAIFSCTVPQEVLNFASALNLREPVRVLVRRENNQSETSTQSPNLRSMKHFFLYLAMGNGMASRGPGGGRQELNSATREWKLEALVDLCADADFTQAVVYCSSIDAVESVTYRLVTRNIDAMALHGDMGAAARHGIINKFRSGNAAPGRGNGMKRVLVVYDALCRTLSDIHQVALVVNYDLPRAVEDYVHRVSCAASSGYGRAGTSVNIVSSPGDIEMLRAIESFYRLKINELPPVLTNIC